MESKLGYEYVHEIDNYFNEIKHYRSLSKKEEKELSERIQNGDRNALNKLVTHNLKFVVNMAKNYRDRGVPFPDLISEGNMGLIHAAEKFDGSKNIKFISYAVWWIKNSFNECIENYKANTEIHSDIYSMDKEKMVERENNLINEEFEEQLYTIQSRQQSISELLKCLHEREMKIIKLFYGLNDGKEMTLEEVGNEMHLTMERVRQIKDTAIMKLKCEALSMNSDEIAVLKELR